MTSDGAPAVFTRSRARALQIPLVQLLGPDYLRLFHDTYVAARHTATVETRAATVMARIHAAHHVSHHTAVQLWGGTPPESPDIHVSMTSRESRCRRSGVAAHLGHVDNAVTQLRGLQISTPTQAFLDLAGMGVSLVDLVIAGDSLAKATGTQPSEFMDAARLWRGRNARRARRAASLVREGVDSPMETRLRLLIVFAGLPEPTVNVTITLKSGRWKWRFDLCYPDCKLIVEYDGRQHAFDHDQWSHDLERREALDQLGWRMIVVQSDGIYRDPLRTLGRIRDALDERGIKRLPKRFDVEWTRHFVNRA
jgi:hypothetical protein